MNDFTKEELLIIHLDMCTYVEQNKILKESPSHRALRDKVESMIDNYCEHKIVINTECPMCGSEMQSTAGLDLQNIWKQACTNGKCDYVRGFKL